MKSLIIQKLPYFSWRAGHYLAVTHRRYKSDRIATGYHKLKKNQEKFQVEDGCPIHLKKGLVDKALYYSTMVLATVGVAWSFKSYYNMICPSKEDDSEDNSD